MGQFVQDMTWYLRNLLLIKTADSNEDIIDLSSENMLRLKEEAKRAPEEVIMRYIRILSELSGQIRYASQKRIAVEVALIKLCRPQMESDNESVIDRIRQVESKVDEKMAGLASGAYSFVTVNPQNIDSANDDSKAKEILEKALPEDIKDAVSKWGIIVAESEYSQYLKGSYPSLEGDSTLAIIFNSDYSMAYAMCKQPDKMKRLKDNISEIVGKDITISLKLEGENGISKNTFPDIRSIIDEKIDFDVDEIDDSELEDDEYVFDEVERNEEDG